MSSREELKSLRLSEKLYADRLKRRRMPDCNSMRWEAELPDNRRPLPDLTCQPERESRCSSDGKIKIFTTEDTEGTEEGKGMPIPPYL